MLKGEFYDLSELFQPNPDSKVYNLVVTLLSHDDVKN